MRSSIVLTPTTRFIALVALASALTVASPLWRGDDLAHATTKQQCQQKMQACGQRCEARAGYRSGMSREEFDKAFNAEVGCLNRTCMHQLKNCLASASDADKPTSAVDPGSPTRPVTGKVVPGGPGLLESGPGFSTTGPAPTGSPAGGAASGAPTAGQLR